MIHGLFGIRKTSLWVTAVRRILPACVFVPCFGVPSLMLQDFAINTSSVMPIGSLPDDFRPTSDLVEFCPPGLLLISQSSAVTAKRENCPGRGAPLLKPLIAHDGDFTETSSQASLSTER